MNIINANIVNGTFTHISKDEINNSEKVLNTWKEHDNTEKHIHWSSPEKAFRMSVRKKYFLKVKQNVPSKRKIKWRESVIWLGSHVCRANQKVSEHVKAILATRRLVFYKFTCSKFWLRILQPCIKSYKKNKIKKTNIFIIFLHCCTFNQGLYFIWFRSFTISFYFYELIISGLKF